MYLWTEKLFKGFHTRLKNMQQLPGYWNINQDAVTTVAESKEYQNLSSTKNCTFFSLNAESIHTSKTRKQFAKASHSQKSNSATGKCAVTSLFAWSTCVLEAAL